VNGFWDLFDIVQNPTASLNLFGDPHGSNHRNIPLFCEWVLGARQSINYRQLKRGITQSSEEDRLSTSAPEGLSILRLGGSRIKRSI
jgi:hypothetical protein